jgi:hypothetical protein
LLHATPVRKMRSVGGSIRACAWAVALAVVLGSSPAFAQLPVCPAVAPGERVQLSCKPFSLLSVGRFLADFSVDQLFKPSPPPFRRTILEAAQLFVPKELSDSPALLAWTAALAPLRFTQLDRTTGTVQADYSKSDRDFEETVAGFGSEVRLTLRMPERLQGGYWRAPDVLQITFWERQRAAFVVESPAGSRVEAELECVSLTPDGLLLRLSGGLPPILVLVRECPQ